MSTFRYLVGLCYEKLWAEVGRHRIGCDVKKDNTECEAQCETTSPFLDQRSLSIAHCSPQSLRSCSYCVHEVHSAIESPKSNIFENII